jgi:hypothetical protein
LGSFDYRDLISSPDGAAWFPGKTQKATVKIFHFVVELIDGHH